MDPWLLIILDMLGTFAFATSGAAAAKERQLDWFGVFTVAYLTACGGGILRDLVLGTVPPVGITEWRYVVCVAAASVLTVGAGAWVERLEHPVKWFDSVGLGFFAVVGAHQALRHGAGVPAAVIVGVVAAVGGGVMRDVLLNRVPVILEKEIYALAALGAAVIQVVSQVNDGPLGVTQGVAIGTCLGIRFLALRYAWSLPVAGGGRGPG